MLRKTMVDILASMIIGGGNRGPYRRSWPLLIFAIEITSV